MIAISLGDWWPMTAQPFKLVPGRSGPLASGHSSCTWCSDWLRQYAPDVLYISAARLDMYRVLLWWTWKGFNSPVEPAALLGYVFIAFLSLRRFKLSFQKPTYLPIMADFQDTLSNTTGALESGVMISNLLFGCLTMQIYAYYQNYPHDRWQLKVLVRKRNGTFNICAESSSLSSWKGGFSLVRCSFLFIEIALNTVI